MRRQTALQNWGVTQTQKIVYATRIPPRPSQRPEARGQRPAAVLLSGNLMETRFCAKSMYSHHHDDFRLHLLHPALVLNVFWGILGCPRTLWGSLWAPLGALWGSLGLLWGALGALCDPVGLPKGPFGAPWTLLRRPGASLGCPKSLYGAAQGASWEATIELSSMRELNSHVCGFEVNSEL